VRCASCGFENPEGFKFCDQCASPLGAVPGPAGHAPRSYTPKHLAEKILTARSALEGERKQVTVLFADVKGSLELAQQLGAEAWHALLDDFFERLADGHSNELDEALHWIDRAERTTGASGNRVNLPELWELRAERVAAALVPGGGAYASVARREEIR
jgi:hypothetical protein